MADDERTDIAARRHEQHEADQTAEQMAERSEQLGEDIEEARADWERKRRDPSVPGAPAPPEQEGEGGDWTGSWEGEGREARRSGQ